MTLQGPEREILYQVYKKGFIPPHMFSLGYLHSEYKLKFEKEEIEKILYELIEKGYIVKVDVDGFAIPVLKKYKEIEKIFLWLRAKDWLVYHLRVTWEFVWKHFIVTIITAVITAYLTTRFLN